MGICSWLWCRRDTSWIQEEHPNTMALTYSPIEWANPIRTIPFWPRPAEIALMIRICFGWLHEVEKEVQNPDSYTWFPCWKSCTPFSTGRKLLQNAPDHVDVAKEAARIQPIPCIHKHPTISHVQGLYAYLGLDKILYVWWLNTLIPSGKQR